MTTLQAPKKVARFTGLKVWIFSMTMAASLIPLSLYGTAAYQAVTEEANRVADETLLSGNKANARIVGNWIDSYEQSIKALANSESMRAMDKDRIRAELAPYSKALPNFYALMVIDPSGQQIARSDNEKHIYVGDRDYVKKVFEGASSYIQSAVSRINNKPFLGFSAAIKNGESTVGVLAALGTVENFADQVTGGKIGKSGYSYLVDRSSLIVMAHADKALVSKKLTEGQMRRMNQANQEVVMSDITDDGVRIHYATSPVGNRMVLISEMPETEALGPVMQARQTAAIFAVLAVIVSGALSLIMATSLSRRITRITALAAAISRANSTKEISALEAHLSSVGGARELRQNAAAIRRLATTIRSTMKS